MPMNYPKPKHFKPEHPMEENQDQDNAEGAPRPFNMNHYATKKSAAQIMLDFAYLMANTSQLKSVLHSGSQHHFYTPLIALISTSISLQVIVGLLLIFIVKYDLDDVKQQPRLSKMNDMATVFVFIIVLINIFITALGFDFKWCSIISDPQLAQTRFLNSTNDA